MKQLPAKIVDASVMTIEDPIAGAEHETSHMEDLYKPIRNIGEIKQSGGGSAVDNNKLDIVTVSGEEELNRTIEIMVGRIEGVWTCNVCRKTVKRKQDLQRHIESVHTTGLLCICNICGKNFKSRGSL